MDPGLHKGSPGHIAMLNPRKSTSLRSPPRADEGLLAKLGEVRERVHWSSCHGTIVVAIEGAHVLREADILHAQRTCKVSPGKVRRPMNSKGSNPIVAHVHDGDVGPLAHWPGNPSVASTGIGLDGEHGDRRDSTVRLLQSSESPKKPLLAQASSESRRSATEESTRLDMA